MANKPLTRQDAGIGHIGRRHHARGDAGPLATDPRPGTPSARGIFPRVSSFVVEYLLALPVGALIALAWANLRPESYFQTAYTLSFFVNDIAMVFFFALMTKEIVEATIPGGVLHTWRRLLPPLVAAAGAALVPALFYVGVVRAMEEPMLAQGWPVTIAVDLALAYFLARMIFGRHPLIPFVLLLAIAADGIGFLLLAGLYPVREANFVAAVGLLALALGSAAGLRRLRIRSFWPYVVVGGTLSWLALFEGGFHPALALVPIMPFLPHAPRDPGFFVDAPPDARDALNRFELSCRYPAQVAVFLFGLVNGGVLVSALEPGAWSVPIAAVAGRPVGVLLGCAFALAAGLHLPARVGWRELSVVGLITGTGFTVALFFATAIFAPGQMLTETKTGALLTLLSALLALALARLLRVGRFAR